MVDPRRPDLGAEPQKDRRTLTTRIAQWMHRSSPMRSISWQGEEQAACEHLKYELEKYYEMGENTNRKEQ